MKCFQCIDRIWSKSSFFALVQATTIIRSRSLWKMFTEKSRRWSLNDEKKLQCVGFIVAAPEGGVVFFFHRTLRSGRLRNRGRPNKSRHEAKRIKISLPQQKSDTRRWRIGAPDRDVRHARKTRHATAIGRSKAAALIRLQPPPRLTPTLALPCRHTHTPTHTHTLAMSIFLAEFRGFEVAVGFVRFLNSLPLWSKLENIPASLNRRFYELKSR